MSYKTDLALQDARGTLRDARCVIDEKLTRSDPGQDGVSMAPRQAKELAQFIQAHCSELERYCAKVEAAPTDINVQLLTTRHMELEEALRFIKRAFIQPRSTGDEIQVLLAADWMSVEGFQLFVPDSEESPDSANSPVGPLVAIDSSQSPAVWAPDAELPVPSLFRVQPRKIARDNGDARTLPPFPLICLPGHLVRCPEYYPLLSHEVGHAVDNALGLSARILEALPRGLQMNHWKGWMREILADAVGVTLSGEGFLVALTRYLDVLTPFEEISASNPYPGNTLRRALVGACLRHLSSELSVADLIPPDDDRRFTDTARGLLTEFREQVLPVIAPHTFDKNSNWLQERQTAVSLMGMVASEASPVWPSQPFRLLPSVIALTQKDDPSLKTYARFRDLHKSITNPPDWVDKPSQWVFSEEYLPSLRPTLLGADGKFKVPPLLLLGTHQKIAFVGATNWQLADKMKQAFEARGGKPWDEIHLFFATNELLQQIEYGEKNSQQYRDESEKEFREILQQGQLAKHWSIYRFSGPPVFASYWDWDARGGRIHISPALLGTVIGECPASDHIWHQASPTDQYQKYVKHLETLLNPRSGRTVVMSSESRP